MPASSRDAFLWAIGQQESGGVYTRVNAQSGALGKYQVMPAHLNGGNEWAGRVFGHAVTRQQFLHSPAMQEQMASKILGGYYDKYGAAGAAAAWYSGQPDPTKTFGDPPVYKYVNSVLALMKRAPADAGKNAPGPVSPGGSTSGTDVVLGLDKRPPDCLVGFPYGVGYLCILTKGQGRAIAGSLLLGAGGIVAGAGLIILAAYGLKKSGALDAAASAAAALPGSAPLASGLRSAAGRVRA